MPFCTLNIFVEDFCNSGIILYHSSSLDSPYHPSLMQGQEINAATSEDYFQCF